MAQVWVPYGETMGGFWTNDGVPVVPTNPYAQQALGLLGNRWGELAQLWYPQYLQAIDTPEELTYMRSVFNADTVPHLEELSYQLAGFSNPKALAAWQNVQAGTATNLEKMIADNPGMVGQSVLRPDIPDVTQGVADPNVVDNVAYTKAMYDKYGITPEDYSAASTNWAANNTAAAQAARDDDGGLGGLGGLLGLALTAWNPLGLGLVGAGAFGGGVGGLLSTGDIEGALTGAALGGIGGGIADFIQGGGYIDALGGMTDATGTALGDWAGTGAGELAADFGGFEGVTAGDLLGSNTGGLETLNAQLPVGTTTVGSPDIMSQFTGQLPGGPYTADYLSIPGVDDVIADTALTGTTATTAAGTGTLGSIGGTGAEALAAADAAGGLLTPAQVAASAAATPGILTQLATALGTTPSTLTSLLSGGLNLAGGLLTADAASDAAQKQADTQLKIAEMMRFRPVGVTTRFGSSNFGYDPATGNLTSAGYTLSPEAKALQDSLMATAPGLLGQFTNARQTTAPMGTAAQNAMTLGNQYLTTSPQQQAAKYMAEQMALLQPYNERNLANLEAKLQAQGRLGLATGGTSTLAASNPELEALMNAQKMQQLQLAAAATQGGMDYAKFGAGMVGTGGNLLNSMYNSQSNAFNPYNTALTGANTLEGMGQQAMNLGTTLGAQQTTANTPAANLMGQAAATQAAGNAVSPWGALLSGAGSALSNYQSQQQQQQYQQQLLSALSGGNSIWR